MKLIKEFEFQDFHNLTDSEVLDVIKFMCEFDDIEDQYFIDIFSKSHYKNIILDDLVQVITYKIKIYDLSTTT